MLSPEIRQRFLLLLSVLALMGIPSFAAAYAHQEAGDAYPFQRGHRAEYGNLDTEQPGLDEDALCVAHDEAPVEHLGPDFAAAPSIAASSKGEFHIAFLVTDESRNGQVGLYHGVASPEGLGHEWVAPVNILTQGRQHDATGTSIAVDNDDAPHVIYPSTLPPPDRRVPVPFSSEYNHATTAGSSWIISPIAPTGPGAPYLTEVGPRAIPDIIAGQGRLMVALPVYGGGFVLAERQTDASWAALLQIENARFPRLAVGADGSAHVAWLEVRAGVPPTPAPRGAVLYASEANGWSRIRIAEDTHDQSASWNTAETDGSFAFALDADGVAWFLWARVVGEQNAYLGRLDDENLHVSPISLVMFDGWGLRFRLKADAGGGIHILGGNGMRGHYIAWSDNDKWLCVSNAAHRMFGLALSPTGQPGFIYTLAHGGSTLGFSTILRHPEEEDTDLRGQGGKSPALGGAATMAALFFLVYSLRGVRMGRRVSTPLEGLP